MSITAIRNVHQSSVAIMLAKLAERDAQIAHIAAVLDWFQRQPVSMASIQPVLDLAAELNPRTEAKS